MPLPRIFLQKFPQRGSPCFMPAIVILAVGKTRSPFIQAGIDHYLRRLQRYYPASLVTVREEKPCPGLTPAQILAREGERLLARLPRPAQIITLEVAGRQYSSPELAQWLQQRLQAGGQPLVFIVGGHLGLAPEVLALAHHRLSLSRLTFPHELCRLMLLEQLYRAATILAGHPYHW